MWSGLLSQEFAGDLCLFKSLFTFIALFLFAGEKGVGVSTAKPLHYKGSTFHRIIKGFMAQVCCSFV